MQQILLLFCIFFPSFYQSEKEEVCSYSQICPTNGKSEVIHQLVITTNYYIRKISARQDQFWKQKNTFFLLLEDLKELDVKRGSPYFFPLYHYRPGTYKRCEYLQFT